MPAELSSRLADLADRYPSLHYDEESGVSKFDTDVLFDSGEARLTPPARKMLAEFAEIFQAPEAHDLKIMVVGHTDARVSRGAKRARNTPTIGIRAPAGPWPWSTACARQGCRKTGWGSPVLPSINPSPPTTLPRPASNNRGMEIFVVGPETPVVGWTETLGSSVYR